MIRVKVHAETKHDKIDKSNQSLMTVSIRR